MRRTLAILIGCLLASALAPAQVIGVQPTPMGMYQWDSTTQQFARVTNSYAMFALQNTPEPFAFYGWNSTLNQWVPCDAVTASCPGLGMSNTGGTTPPSGSCPVDWQLFTRTPSGPIYECISGTWTEISSLALEHNGTALADQALLNFLDAAPALPAGYQPVTWGSDGAGGLGAWVPLLSSGLALEAPLPPIGGQYAIVHPSGCTVNYLSGNVTGSGECQPPYFAGSLACGLSGPVSQCSVGLTFGFTLPSYISQANVTAVYPYAYSQASGPGNGWEVTGFPFCTSTTPAQGEAVGPASLLNSWGLRSQTGAAFSGPPTVSGITCNMAVGASLTNSAPGQAGFAPALIVYYTGAAPPASTAVSVVPPLYFDGANLSLPLPFDFVDDHTNTNTYAGFWTSSSTMASGLEIKLFVTHSNTTTTPTLALNGGAAFPIVGAKGTAVAIGDLSATLPNVLIFDGSKWDLQNPQVSGASGSLSGMTAGQVPIATTASTVTSSKALAGSGAGIATGPTTTTLGDCVKFNDALGTLADAGAACGAGGGVTQIVAGVNTSVSPSAGTGAVTVNGVPNVIWDDDATNDADAAVNEWPVVNAWVKAKQLNLLAVINDSSNAYAAPAAQVLKSFYGLGNIPIGAWLGAVPSSNSTGNVSAWTSQLVAAFNPGDINTNYVSCVTVYRQALQAAPAASVNIVTTGFLTCLSALMQSPADAVSALTGAQLIQSRVKSLTVMGGYEPSTGSNEFNFLNDAVSAQYVLANWTSGNSYPPIYFLGTNSGAASVITGVSSSYPTTYPPAFVGNLVASYTRPSWDILALYSVVFPLDSTAFTLSANGTNTVTSTSGGTAGTNSFSTGTASGHYYLTLAQANTYYQYVLGAAILQSGDANVADLNTPILPTSTVATTAPITATNTGNANFMSPGNFFTPNLAAASNMNLNFGVTNTTNNAAYLGMYYAGAGSTSNYARLGFSGGTDIARFYASGAFVLPNISASTSPLCPNGTSGALTTSGCAIANQALTNAANTFTAAQTITATVAGGVLNVNQNNNTTYDAAANFLCPSLSASSYCYLNIGVAGSTNNEMGFNFYYAGAGSAGNYATVNFYGGSPIERWFASGNSTFGSATDPGKSVGIGSSNQLTVDSSGNLVTTGAVSGASFGQSAASSTGGTCAMAAATSCAITLGQTYTTPVCIVTQQSSTLTGGAAGCTVSGATVTITAAVANSETWGALVFGNPN